MNGCLDELCEECSYAKECDVYSSYIKMKNYVRVVAIIFLIIGIIIGKLI